MLNLALFLFESLTKVMKADILINCYFTYKKYKN
jgi:hypothetical protein